MTARGAASLLGRCSRRWIASANGYSRAGSPIWFVRMNGLYSSRPFCFCARQRLDPARNRLPRHDPRSIPILPHPQFGCHADLCSQNTAAQYGGGVTAKFKKLSSGIEERLSRCPDKNATVIEDCVQIPSQASQPRSRCKGDRYDVG